MTKKQILLTIFFICAILFTGCNKHTDERPTVISTIGMIDDIVKNIGGDKVQRKSLMGPGVDPHLYKASAGDVEKLSKANLIFYNGLHLEAKMIEIFEKMSKKILTIPVTKSIPTTQLLASQEYEGYYDPHVWFDVSLWVYAAKEVTNGLIKLDPKNKTYYKSNEKTYITQLQNLDQWIKTSIDIIPKDRRLLITAHDAFSYFGLAYEFKVVGLQGINTASEAGTKDIQDTTKIIIENNIPAIFIESSVPVRHIKALQAAVKAKGNNVEIGEALFTDAMGNPNTEEGTYIGMIKHNINSIINGLK